MVQVMEVRSIDDFEEKSLSEPFGHNFISQMPINIDYKRRKYK
jgi:hypothetical protein